MQYLQTQDIFNRVFRNVSGRLKASMGYYSTQDYLNAVFDPANDALRVNIEGGMLPAVGSIPELPDSTILNAVCPVTTGDRTIQFYQWDGTEWIPLGGTGTAATFEIVQVDTLDPDESVEIVEAPDSTAWARKYIVRIPRGEKGERGYTVSNSFDLSQGYVDDPNWGGVGYLYSAIPENILSGWFENVVKLRVVGVPLNTAHSGNVVLYPKVNGVRGPKMVVAIGNAPTGFDITFDTTKTGYFGIERDSGDPEDTLNDAYDVEVTLVVLSIGVHNA